MVSCGAAWAADCALQQLLRSSAWQDNSVVHAIANAANWWGGPGVIWFAGLLWLGARAARRHRASEIGLRGAEGIAASSAISGIIKGLAGRSRPFIAPGEPWHWSFAHGWTDARYFSMPSGHTTATFGFAIAASMAAATLRPAPRVAFTVAAFATAVLVAFARVYLDQHWLSDVAAGAALGSVTGFAIARWHARHPGSRFDRILLDGR
jgi:undecaprenyl-diphosphatase